LYIVNEFYVDSITRLVGKIPGNTMSIVFFKSDNPIAIGFVPGRILALLRSECRSRWPETERSTETRPLLMRFMREAAFYPESRNVPESSRGGSETQPNQAALHRKCSMPLPQV